MTRMLFAAAVAAATIVAGAAGAQADPFKGPHKVLHYKQSSYIAVPFANGNGKTLRFYRARGPFWQKWGATFIAEDQRASNGSIRQNIFFKGAHSRTLYIDLRNKANLFFGGRRG